MRWVCQRLVCQRLVSEEGVCFKIVFLCQDVKFKDPKFKHEIFVRIDMKHSYFSNYFIFCLQSFFSVVEIIIELFVCQKNYGSCYITKF